MYKRIVVTGSLAYDHIMSMPTRFADHIMPDKIHILNVSFIMEKFQREFGGTGGNISYSLNLLKIPSILFATAGNDFDPYFKHLKKLECVDTSGIKIYKSIATASGFVMTDKDDNQIWSFYEGAMKKAIKLNLSKIRKSDFLVIAPNDPLAMIRYAFMAQKMKIPYMFDPAFNIPHFKVSNLRKAVEKATILIGNDYEIELIRRKLGWKKHQPIKGNKIVITTLGSKGSSVQKGAKTISVRPAKPKNTSDPTGAGDAFRAGFLAGYFKEEPLKVCAQMGSVSSVYTVEKYGTQTHKFSVKEFMNRYKSNYNENLAI